MSVGVGVVGLGFMGAVHVRAYADAGARLVAVCDRNESQRAGEPVEVGNIGDGAGDRLFDPAGVNATDDLDAFLATPGLELVSVCTPTDTHVEGAARAMRAGKHVLVEKPVALTEDAVLGLDAVAREAGVLCMPALCMRFWPAGAWAAEAVRNGRYGPVVSARLKRVGGVPSWSTEFYADASRSGDALCDLHVHDTDFIVGLLGVPDSVVSVGSPRHVTTSNRYTGGPGKVVSEGGWLHATGLDFRMRMTIACSDAVIDFDLGRNDQLRVHPADGETFTPEIDGGDGWQAEVAAMVDAVRTGAEKPPVTLAEAAASTAVLERELRSLETGGPA